MDRRIKYQQRNIKDGKCWLCPNPGVIVKYYDSKKIFAIKKLTWCKKHYLQFGSHKKLTIL